MRNIDNLFKKKLNTPQQPPEDAWAYIQKHIESKETKPVYPLWLRISGVGSVLLLMVGIGYFIGKESSLTNSQPLNETTKSSLESKINSQEQSGINELNKNENLNYENQESYSTTVPSDYDSNEAESDLTHFIQNSNSNSSVSSQVFNQTIEPLFNDNIQIYNQLKLSKDNYLPEIAYLPLQIMLKENQYNHTILLTQPTDSEKKKFKSKKMKMDFDRFYVSGYASPMAFNTFVGGSMLSDEMNQYHTENNVTLAYGMKAGYSVSPKLKVRTGVSMIGFEQLTKDVSLASNVNGRPGLPPVDHINNVSYNGYLRIDNSVMHNFANTEMVNKVGTGDIQQQASFLEIPLEAEYSLFQTNSIGISATGGASTLILSKNKLYVHTDDFTEELGKASNLNGISFSANAGLKFDMNISEKVKFNVEPNFKYLINPVNDIEKYNPYTVGVNAGLSVSFK